MSTSVATPAASAASLKARNLSALSISVLGNLSRGLYVAPDTCVDDQLREILTHHLHHRRSFDDDAFRPPCSVFGNLTHDEHQFGLGDLCIDRHPHFAPMIPG